MINIIFVLRKKILMTGDFSERQRLPHWMRMKMPMGENYSRVKNLVQKYALHTICTSGNCPNIGECWNRGTATFMILGDICTRNCKFCAVKSGKPLPPDKEEAVRLAESVLLMGIRHCVITSVDRDDLADQGARIWADCIMEIKRRNQDIKIEALIPDFRGNKKLIQQVADAGPDLMSHNLETVERLTPVVRSASSYKRSLDVLRFISSIEKNAKSGIMLGLGESLDEIYQTMDDLLDAGCKIMTIGQYLAPSKNHLRVTEYFSPDFFESLRLAGLAKGFRFIESKPMVRSSYHAENHLGI
jgi:lipoyl synthase